MTVRTRFAPSPTGYLHLGGLRTALYAYLFAKKYHGTFILRIEDTDQDREVPGATELIYASMRRAGLIYDEGPDVGGDYGPYIQTERKSVYRPYAEELIKTNAAYPCFCTKEALEERRAAAQSRGETFKYDKHCLSLDKAEVQRLIDAGLPYVIRQNIPVTGFASFDDLLFGHVEAPCDTLDDNVLIKQDGLPTYNFANVIDDHLMEISHVMRGTEYLSSAPKYNLLYQAFGWTPPVYIHLPVVMKDATRKLSKRYGDPSFEDLLAKGYVKDAIINFIALLGWSPGDDREFFTLKELEEAFHTEGLNKAPAIFNIDKLTWFNAQYISKMDADAYLAAVTPWFDTVLTGDAIDYRRLAELTQGRTEVFDRVPDMVRFLAELPDYDLSLYTHPKLKTSAETAVSVLSDMIPILTGIHTWTETVLHDTVMARITQTGIKTGAALWPLRIAVSGTQNTPGGFFEISGLLGRDETLLRLRNGLSHLAGSL